jgi:hypothetical protein
MLVPILLAAVAAVSAVAVMFALARRRWRDLGSVSVRWIAQHRTDAL